MNPVIGVRHLSVERLMVACDNMKPPYAVIGKPLGYLMPGRTFVTWRFTETGDTVAVAESLATAVVDFGLPFIGKYADWDRLRADIGDYLLDVERAKVLPIMALVDGNPHKAEALVREECRTSATAATCTPSRTASSPHG